MKVISTSLPDVLVLEPKVHGDERGYFYESFNERRFNDTVGIEASTRFVQDNHSRSARNVLRGLHYQIHHPQGKLVRVTAGEVFDVAVDLRRTSPHFGQWTGVMLSADNRKQVWIPEGFGHGFVVLSDHAEVLYKTTGYWSAPDERCIAWDDPAIGIRWPVDLEPILSPKDQHGAALADAEVFA